MPRVNGLRTFAIASGQTNSDVAGIGEFRQGSFTIPGTFTGTAVTVQVSNSATGTFKAVEVEGEETNPVTVAAGTAYRFPISTFSYPYVRLVSGSSEAAARSIAGWFSS